MDTILGADDVAQQYSPDRSVFDAQQLLTDTGNSSRSHSHSKDRPAQVSVPTYNPAALLNPKAASKRALDDPNPKDIQSNDLSEVAKGRNDEVDYGSMIERQHGVTKREALPQKRQKTQHDDLDESQRHNKNQSFVGGGKGGVIGEYMKQKREEGQAEAGPLSNVVDLTADDDDVVITKATGPSSDPNREVCLGTFSAKVNAHRVPTLSNKLAEANKTKWLMSRISLSRGTAPMVVEVRDKTGIHFGYLDTRSASAFVPLLQGVHIHKMHFNALLDERPRKDGEVQGQPISELLDIKVTLFVIAKCAEGIGRMLSQKQVFLGPPVNSEQIEVLNPHLPKLNWAPKKNTGPIATLTSQTIGSYASRTVEDIRSDVVGMLNTITDAEELPAMEVDSSLFVTEPMEHQKQALWFLSKRETTTQPNEEPLSTLWKSSYKKDGAKVYYNVISGDEVKKVEDSLGGIFADDMGLGKTLSTLSRIVTTIDEARAFGKEDLGREFKDHDSVERNTGGTLIVCPKSVMSNWESQIKLHIIPNKLKIYIYHGPKREQDADELAKYDVVITTFTTVAMEHKSTRKFKALSKLNWFRIVLDEAHHIRNQSTAACHAACDLVSRRRWAVTGTPIMNRLEDLGALIKFVKISPFHQKGSFERHFLAPFKTGDVQVLDNLRLLVDSITLRRSKKKIDLPEKNEYTVRLDFADHERGLYEAFAKEAGNQVNALTRNGALRGKGYAHMLTTITRLRLICAHGKDLLSDEDMKMIAGRSVDEAIELGDDDDIYPSLTEDMVYNQFRVASESGMNICEGPCARIIGEPEEGEEDESEEGDENETIGYMTPCLHIYCPQCIKKYRIDLGATANVDGVGQCPQDMATVKLGDHPITRKGVDAEQERRAIIRKDRKRPKNSGGYEGPHTKVKELVTRLLQNRRESDLLYNEPPIRSVVFSGWTQYLDLMEIAMEDADLGYLRLDGKMSVKQRSQVLEQFASDPTISVVLVSIKAGGQGLNFTAANKVYMMEPQFNPGVEKQAVDRVHRLGQTREVEIVKFIMTDSFEEKIVTLQQQKLELANTAFNRDGKRMSKQENQQKRMEDLRSLFR